MKTLPRKLESANNNVIFSQVEFNDPKASPADVAAEMAAATSTAPPGAAVRQRQPPRLHPHQAAPDFEEGPHSQLGEDEFFDAVEDALDRIQAEQTSADRLKKVHVEETPGCEGEGAPWQPEPASLSHPLWAEIDRTTLEQLRYARMMPGEDGVWELFAEEGEMKMYKREEEVDGMVVDPLKALHQVRGVSARELCLHFFAPEFRMEWEITLDKVSQYISEVLSNMLVAGGCVGEGVQRHAALPATAQAHLAGRPARLLLLVAPTPHHAWRPQFSG